MLLRSTAIVIDSDSEDGIETDDDDDDDDSGEDQDILGLLSQMADDSGLRMATATVGRTQSTSVLETCRARTDIVERCLSKGRALDESRTFAGSILSQASPVAYVCVSRMDEQLTYSTLDVSRLIP